MNTNEDFSCFCPGEKENLNSKGLGSEAVTRSIWLSVFREFMVLAHAQIQRMHNGPRGLCWSFPLNTKSPPLQRAWIKELVDKTGKNHGNYKGNLYRAIQASLFPWSEERLFENSLF